MSTETRGSDLKKLLKRRSNLMKSVSVKTAQKHFAEIVEGARKGSNTVITRGGKDVAMVTPISSTIRYELPDLAEFRAAIRVKGKPLSEIILAQRRGSRY